MEPIHILLVEDNEGDILLTTEALENAKLFTKLSVVKDGKQAIDFLTNADGFSHATQPDMLLLDINLPKKNGHEVLKFIKENDVLKHIPVIMLTTSSSPSDINQAYTCARIFIFVMQSLKDYKYLIKIFFFYANAVIVYCKLPMR